MRLVPALFLSFSLLLPGGPCCVADDGASPAARPDVAHAESWSDADWAAFVGDPGQDLFRLAEEWALGGKQALLDRLAATCHSSRKCREAGTYAGQRGRAPADAITAAACAKASEFARAGMYESALQLLEGSPDGRPVVTAVDALLLRGDCARRLSDTRSRSPAIYLEAANQAVAAGWFLGQQSALRRAAAAYRLLGDLEGARRTYERLRLEELKQGREGDAAVTLANLANILAIQHECASALGAFESALEVQTRLGMARVAATTKGNLGYLYTRMGRLSRALELIEDSLAYFRSLPKKSDEQWSTEADGMQHLGGLRSLLGEPEEALRAFEGAKAIFRMTKDTEGAALATANQAVVQWDLGEPAKAEALAREALQGFESPARRGRAHRGHVPRARDPRGAGRRSRRRFRVPGRLREARARGEGPLARRRGALGAVGRPPRPGGVGTAQERAQEAVDLLEGVEAGPTRSDRALRADAACIARGDAKQAMRVAQRALGELVRLRAELVDADAGGLASVHKDLSESGVIAAIALGDETREMRFLELGRAGSFLASLGGDDAVRAAAVPARLHAEELAAHAAYVEADRRLGMATIEQRVDPAATEALLSSEKRIQRVAERIELRKRIAARLTSPALEALDDWRSRARADDGLVYFSWLRGKGHAFVLEGTGPSRNVDLPGAAEAVKAWQEALRKPPANDWPALVDALRSTVVAPIELSATTTRLRIVAEGTFFLLPWGALAGRACAVVPSASCDRLLRDGPQGAGVGILALGGCDYTSAAGEDARRIYRSYGNLGELPGSKEEVEAFGDVKLVGPEARRDRLLEELARHPSRWRALHFACHGLVMEDRPLLSALAFTATAGDPGLFTVLDALSLDAPADLVVLSACASGRGKIVTGEGVLELRPGLSVRRGLARDREPLGRRRRGDGLFLDVRVPSSLGRAQDRRGGGPAARPEGHARARGPEDREDALVTPEVLGRMGALGPAGMRGGGGGGRSARIRTWT